MSGKMNYKELYETNDFILNGDVTSLYPGAMRGFKKIHNTKTKGLDVKYPTGLSKWSDIPEMIIRMVR